MNPNVDLVWRSGSQNTWEIPSRPATDPAKDSEALNIARTSSFNSSASTDTPNSRVALIK